MSLIDYSLEPRSDIAFIDMKSFYASVECIARGLHPLKASLCVMSRADNCKGLILASSPVFKKVFGRKNVGRTYDLPFDIHTRRFSYYTAERQGLPTDASFVRFIEAWARATVIVPPRMSEYIRINMQIQRILQNFATTSEIYPYSIDECFVDLTTSLNYFFPDPTLSRKEKLDLLSAQIQRAIWKETGLYSTVGMSNANPLLAKLALDNFWGIGSRMEKRLNQLKIYTIKELAHADADLLKKHLGIMGVELWFHANGIDESNVHHPYKVKSHGIGNSQILPKDYRRKGDIELILREMAEQVAVRLRRVRKKTTCVSIHVGYSRTEEKKSIQAQRKIDPTNQTKPLTEVVLDLFRQKYTSGAVRRVGISYQGLVDEAITVFSLFDDYEQVEKEEKLQKAVDTIRDEFGFTSLLKANSLLESSRVKARSQLVGGHSAGGLDGLT